MNSTSIELIRAVENVRSNCGPLIFDCIANTSLDDICDQIQEWEYTDFSGCENYCDECMLNIPDRHPQILCDKILCISKVPKSVFDDIITIKRILNEKS